MAALFVVAAKLDLDSKNADTTRVCIVACTIVSLWVSGVGKFGSNSFSSLFLFFFFFFAPVDLCTLIIPGSNSMVSQCSTKLVVAGDISSNMSNLHIRNKHR